MTTFKHKTVGFLAVTAALLLGACANQMEPAQSALAGIDSAVSAASADAGKYIPDQLSAVQTKLADLKTAFEKKDYAAVLTGAPAILTEAQGLLGAAALKKDEVGSRCSQRASICRPASTWPLRPAARLMPPPCGARLRRLSQPAMLRKP